MALSDIQVEDAARVLWDARRAGEVIEGLPADCRPGSLADAYRVQDRLFQEMGRAQAGWFVGCSNPEIQRQLGLPEPYRAPLLADTVFDSPSSLPARNYPGLTLELEFAFRLGRDLPPRVGGYGPAEVAAAVAAVPSGHRSGEQPSGRLDPSANLRHCRRQRQPMAPWSSARAARTGASSNWPRSRSNCRSTVHRSAAAPGPMSLGNPMTVFVWLVNALCEAGIAMKAGDLHNTGSCTAMYFPEPGDRAVARFHGLGEVVTEFPG